MDYSIFKVLTILISLNFSLFGEIYILSYKIVTKNSIVTADSLYVSQLMIPSKKFKAIHRILLESKDRDNNRHIIRQNRDAILNTLFKNGIILKNYDKTIDAQTESQTTMLLPPVYISVDRFSEGSYLTILKERD